MKKPGVGSIRPRWELLRHVFFMRNLVDENGCGVLSKSKRPVAGSIAFQRRRSCHGCREGRFTVVAYWEVGFQAAHTHSESCLRIRGHKQSICIPDLVLQPTDRLPYNSSCKTNTI